MMLPAVAIVGRPNVGKSTLFNRLVGRRSALVANEPGLTRDRHYGLAEWEGRAFQLIDTGGFEAGTSGELDGLIRMQTQVAIDEADVVIMVVDARAGATSTDLALVELLRKGGKPVLHVANKVDGPRQQALAHELYETGVDRVFPVSAEHGLGCDDLIDAVLENLPTPAEDVADETQTVDGVEPYRIRLALVGRPNAGKSALLNRLVGSARSIVSDVPGTTRDPVNVNIDTEHGPFVAVDTAGIRRRKRAAPLMEQIAVLHAQRSIKDADVVCLLIDGSEELALQDAKVAGMAMELGRALIVVLSKEDLVSAETNKRLDAQLAERMGFAAFAPKMRLSSLTGKGVGKLLPRVRRAHEQWTRRIATSELNRFLEHVTRAHHAPAHRGRPVRFYYITQPQIRPPTFVISTNYPEGTPDSYRRYIGNRIRESFGFEGTPLRLLFRPRSKRGEQRTRTRR